MLRFTNCPPAGPEVHILNLFQFSADFNLLLTGTPIQNNLQELYALLAFIEPDLFPKEQVEEFVHYYHGIEKESKVGKYSVVLRHLLLYAVCDNWDEKSGLLLLQPENQQYPVMHRSDDNKII